MSACTTSAVARRQCVYYYYVIAECGGGHVLLATGLCYIVFYIVYLNKLRVGPSAMRVASSLFCLSVSLYTYI